MTIGIISWTGMHTAAFAISEAVSRSEQQVVVIYSNMDDRRESGYGRWIQTSQNDFFGRKFRRLLDEIPEGDALLLVQADACSGDWSGLVHQFEKILLTRPDIGLWSPDIDNTPFPTDLVAIRHDCGDIWEVAQTDGIVLGMSSAVVDRLRRLDFSENNLGWGIDFAAIAFCNINELKVVRDRSLSIHHPESRGYDEQKAKAQMEDFLLQLSAEELNQARAVKKFVSDRYDQKAILARQEGSGQRMNAVMGIQKDLLGTDFLDVFPFVAIETGRIHICSAASPDSLFIQQGNRRYLPLQNNTAFSPRALEFDISSKRGVRRRFVTGQRWSYPGRPTLSTVFSDGTVSKVVPITRPITLDPNSGPVRLQFGASAHRSKAEILIEIQESSGAGRSNVRCVPIDAKYTGEADSADYHMIDVFLENHDTPRTISLHVRCVEGHAQGDALPLVLTSLPHIIPCAEGPTAAATVVVISAEHAPENATTFAFQIEPSEDDLTLVAGRKSYRIAKKLDSRVDLSVSGRTIIAKSDSYQDVTVFVNNRAIQSVRIGPDPLALEQSPDILDYFGTIIELRDPTGNVILASLKDSEDEPDRPKKLRHPDAWLLDGLFDNDFYKSGFSSNETPQDPASHYLGEGWKEWREPAPWFSTRQYLVRYPEVAATKINPFVHYCIFGRHDEDLRPEFDTRINNDIYAAHSNSVAAGPYFEEFDATIGAGRSPRVKAIAYYLPQFHPVDVNNQQWGKGFTEWRQLPRGVPRFMGHVQPRIPRDLGCYSLSEGDAMLRQIELAKTAGLFGFCFYHYWFNGRRVLEKPVDRFLADSRLNFPFCLMWANENWTRTWDGSDREIILEQSYLESDDIPFVDDLARHMQDSRYIRIGGRPIFFVYRVGHIPEPQITLARWRNLFKDRHGLNPLFFQAQAFGDNDPRLFGLDGAIEFPPHKIGGRTPDLSRSIGLFDKSFSGDIRDYSAAVQIACAEPQPDFPLIRTVFPCWDNEARRPGRGTIYANSTPKKFGEWLDWAIKCAETHPIEGEKFVCVNAWNEWAEGAYLEPDVHFGAAYLNEFSRTIFGQRNARSAMSGQKVLLVGHDVLAFGAQTLLVHIGETLKRNFGVDIEFLIISSNLHGGSFATTQTAMEAVGRVTFADRMDCDDATLAKRFRDAGFSHVITNTTPAGRLVPAFKNAGFTVVSLVHELPTLLKNCSLSSEARSIARHSDHVIFPAQTVRDGFETFAGHIDHAAEIFPQGLYNADIATQAMGDFGLRAELGLAPDTKIVLGIGYADLRKGFDRFVSVGLSLAATHSDIAFLWIGPPANEAVNWLLPEIAASGLADRIRLLGHRDDIARFYAAADVFYLSSREDPFPSVVLEALASGLPVVGHQGCGGSDALVAQHGILVAPSDPLGAAGAIRQILQNPDPEAALARRFDIRERYSFDTYVFGLLQRLQPDIAPVSVVIPNYNYAAHIPERLHSVFAQTYPLREVIVLDDASTDDSVAQIGLGARAANRVIDLHVDTANSGSPFAQWRKGAERAKGDYIWIAEADDLSDPDFVARLLDRMVRAGSVLGFVDSRQISETGEPLGDSYRPYLNQIQTGAFDRSFDMDGPEFLARFLAVKNVILNVSGVIIQKQALLEAFASVGAELADYRVAGDWRLYAEICARPGSRVTWLSEALNIHRRHRQSVTHTLNVTKHLSEIRNIHRLVGKKVPLAADIAGLQSSHLAECARHLGLDLSPDGSAI